MKRIFLLFTFFCTSILAFDEDATSLYLANINALMVFTSQDSVGSGKYHFSNINSTMRVLHAPFRYQIPAQTATSNFFISGNAGYNQTEGELHFDIPQKSSNSGDITDVNPVLSTYTGGLGGGWRYNFDAHLSFLLGGEFIYSRVGVVLRSPDDNDFEFINEFFSQKFNDNLSFKGLAELNYTRNVYGYKLNSNLGFRYFNTNSDINILDTISSIYSINSQSYLTQFRIGIETPTLYTLYKWPLTVEIFTEGDLLFGDVSDVLKVDSYAQLGMDTYLYTQDQIWGITRFYISGSAVKGYGIDGYNIGLGLSIGFDTSQSAN